MVAGACRPHEARAAAAAEGQAAEEVGVVAAAGLKAAAAEPRLQLVRPALPGPPQGMLGQVSRDA